MKTRTRPKVWCKQEITNPDNKWEVIGEIKLVSYMRKEESPHLEFFINDEFKGLRGKGIMSDVVAKYLKYLKKWKERRLIAVVKKDNIPSIKILEKNNFIRMGEIRDNYCYMTDLSFTKDKLIKMQELIDRQFTYRKYEKNRGE